MCQTFLLVRFPAIALGHLEPLGQHSGGRSVDEWSLFFLGHLIRRWERSASCRSTSKATWPRLIEMTGRDMPGSCRQSSCALKRTLTGLFLPRLYLLVWLFTSSCRKKSVSRHQSQPLSSDVICLKEMVSTFSSSRPFDHLEVVATLGVGGFGRVELVRWRCRGHCHY